MLKLTPLLVAALAVITATATDLHSERASVEKWRTERVTELTNETGWLTLVGLYWLNPGENTFGRAPSNTLVLDHPNLADTAGIQPVETDESQPPGFIRELGDTLGAPFLDTCALAVEVGGGCGDCGECGNQQRC